MKSLNLFTTAALICLAQTGQAALNAVDPGPYLAETGHFPHWYQDTQATALDLCLSYTVSSRVPAAAPPAYMCTILANPPIFTDTLPIVWDDANFANTNFPDEAFYFSAGAAIDDTTVPDPQGTCVSYGADIEAAFAQGDPAPGDQITFSRIRVRVRVPVTGTYTITHPYGVETAVATTATGGPGAGCNGNNADISITRDIGIGALGDFTGALAGDVGPFLRDPNGPYTETNPTTGVLETYIGDPNLTTPVTIGGVLTAVPGTPVVGGPNGNILRIQGPAGSGIDVQTDLFAVSGKLFEATLPTPLVIERTDYTRSLLGYFQTDVFANAPSVATLSFTDAALNTTAMQDLDANSEFYGFDSVNAPVPLSSINVTATNPPGNLDTTTPSTLVDLVTISAASYSVSTQQLTVEAASSDEVGAPTLSLAGSGLTGSGAAGVSFNAGPLVIPPATVTVTSANGGSDTEAVVLIP